MNERFNITKPPFYNFAPYKMLIYSLHRNSWIKLVFSSKFSDIWYNVIEIHNTERIYSFTKVFLKYFKNVIDVLRYDCLWNAPIVFQSQFYYVRAQSLSLTRGISSILSSMDSFEQNTRRSAEMERTFTGNPFVS